MKLKTVKTLWGACNFDAPGETELEAFFFDLFLSLFAKIAYPICDHAPLHTLFDPSWHYIFFVLRRSSTWTETWDALFQRIAAEGFDGIEVPTVCFEKV